MPETGNCKKGEGVFSALPPVPVSAFPTVIRAGVLGFCMGVRRAVALACRQTGDPGRKVYTLGSLIHNRQVLDDLESRGVKMLSGFSAGDAGLQGACVVIRAHGVDPQTEESLRKCGACIADATCPHVKSSQLKAKALGESGSIVFLAGEKSHAEISGICGYAEQGFSTGGFAPACFVVGNAQEAAAVAGSIVAKASGENLPARKAALIAQTTICENEYMAIAEAITAFFPNLEVAKTICAATAQRQESLRQLLGKVEAVVVVGGEESANVRRLFAIAQASGKRCVLAQSPADIPADFFAFKTVGISAGASSPDSLVDEVERYLCGRPIPALPESDPLKHYGPMFKQNP
jgi:4-hydroxy-3-methylbut-2-enyl diphosphate reductase